MTCVCMCSLNKHIVGFGYYISDFSNVIETYFSANIIDKEKYIICINTFTCV